MSKQGWIKLHRSILDNPVVFADADHFAVWVYLLLNAAHKDGTVVTHRGVKITLSAGQLIVSKRGMSDPLKIPDAKIQRILKRFESEQQIEQQTSRRNRVITIVNWERYQQSDPQNDPQNETQVTHRRPTDDPQNDPQTAKLPLYKKNIKNVNNDNNIITRARDTAFGVSVDNYPVTMKEEQRERLAAMREKIKEARRAYEKQFKQDSSKG